MATASSAPLIPQALLLRLDRRTIDELRSNTKHSNDPQLFSGPNPRLRINGTTRDLKFLSTTQSDLYTYTIKPCTKKRPSSVSGPDHELVNWARVGVIRSKIELRRDFTKSRVDSVDEAAAQALLEQSLASLEKEKQANSTHIAAGVISNSKNRSNHVRGRDLTGRKLHARALQDVTSNSTGPGGRTQQDPLAAVTNSTDPGLTDAYRKVLVHCLALSPGTTESLRKKTCISQDHLTQILPKIASEGRETSQMWDLNSRAYKELDVWKFPYRTEADRKKVVENAIRAFDRLRIAKDEKIWQSLLPPSERNKGTYLSKLNLVPNPQHSNAATPMLQEASVDKKPASAASTPQLGQSPRPANSAKSTTATKRVFATNAAKVQKDRQLADAKEQKRKEKEAAKQKAQQASPKKKSTRPPVPSPLGGRPRVASDVSERAPRPISSGTSRPPPAASLAPSEKPRKQAVNPSTNKPKPGATVASSTTSVKRKAPDTAGASLATAKHRKTDSVSSHSVKSTSSTNPSSTAHTSPDVTFDSGGNSDSSSSVLETLTFMQGVSMAEKFRDQYYPVYAKMYDEQAAKEERGEKVSKEDRERLWTMHRRLEQMKKEIATASKRALLEDL